MNSIACRRYALYASTLLGSGDVAKSSKGVKNLTAEQSSVAMSSRRKNSTYPRKSPNSPKNSE
jgi:hypothetical protein